MIIVISSAIVAVLLTSRLSDDVCCTSDDSVFCSISTFYNTSIVTLVSVVTSSDTSCSGGTVSTGVCPGAGFSGCTTSPCTWVGQFHRLLHLLNRLRKECAVSLVESCCGRFGLRWLREFGPGRCRALSLSSFHSFSLGPLPFDPFPLNLLALNSFPLEPLSSAATHSFSARSLSIAALSLSAASFRSPLPLRLPGLRNMRTRELGRRRDLAVALDVRHE